MQCRSVIVYAMVIVISRVETGNESHPKEEEAENSLQYRLAWQELLSCQLLSTLAAAWDIAFVLMHLS